MADRLRDRVALITGIGGGMGREAALTFAREGALVIGCDLYAEGADETVRLVREAGGDIESFTPVDLSDPDATARFIDEAAAVHGRIDVLYNNASTPKFGPIDQLSIDDWRFVIDNELNLVFYAAKAAWPHLVASSGVIVNIGSIAGHVGVAFMPQNAHGTAKAGVINLTKQLAAEGAKHGVRANSVSPGFTVTPSTQWLVEQRPPEFVKTLEGIPLGRPGRPSDIVNAALFLASDEAAWITGIDIVVDGGATAMG